MEHEDEPDHELEFEYDHEEEYEHENEHEDNLEHVYADKLPRSNRQRLDCFTRACVHNFATPPTMATTRKTNATIINMAVLLCVSAGTRAPC